ncbi:homeobox-leucine zipper protein HDG11-like [Salvia hispanica]|uniref:homeobox-leucine zipper protein HDG11-like n=1 Tax=Salvia hispanica TaxID=49212 RepID=UPI0020091463|nr:homeobox-leucine zipper protein HDG11-like [Salvia hispanica]
MNSTNCGNGSAEEEVYNAQRVKKQYHRHSSQQIQQLEDFYKEYPHPDKNQRQQLSRELGLDQKQIKFWFQNKRTQIKAQNEKADNNALRSQNEKIHFENLAMQEALRTVVCPACNATSLADEDKTHILHTLRMENARLKQEYQQTMDYFSNYMGNPAVDSLKKHPLGEGVGVSPQEDYGHMPPHSENLVPPHDSTGTQDLDKSSLIEAACDAMNELIELFRVNEPLWIKSRGEGRYTLHRDSYDKLFPRSSHLKTTSARFESSKDSAEVDMAATHLIERLLDVDKWKDMFPTIVIKARIIESIDTGILGGLLHLMYEKRHILSPLVAPREFFFIRYCRQLNSSTWMMVDVSYDFIKELQDADPMRSWKLPSGCMIQDMSNGKSAVTWIEHVQVDDKSLTHRMYRDLVCNGQAYGAKRWTTSLKRMCERFAFSMGITTKPKHELEGVISSLEGKQNVMKLCHRMEKSFCEVLSMSDKLDFPQLSDQSSGVRVSLRRSNGAGQPEGFIVSAATSLWLPLSKENLFNFFKDENKRAEWDVLSSGNPVHAVACIPTGTNPGNCISIIQPFVPEETKMLMLQESSIDTLGGTMIYTPIDLAAMISVVNGEDAMQVPILPSGFIISDDGRASKGVGSLLTVAFQILVCRNTLTKQLNMESVATVHTLISSTVQKIKLALDYSD